MERIGVSDTPAKTQDRVVSENGEFKTSDKTIADQTVTHNIPNESRNNTTVVPAGDFGVVDSLLLNYTTQRDQTGDIQFSISVLPTVGQIYEQQDGATGTFQEPFDFSPVDITAVVFETTNNDTFYGCSLELTNLQANERSHYHPI